jgi:hemerythrin superfamily protein
MRYEGERVQSQHTQLGELHQLIADALGRGEVHSARSAFEQFQAALRAHLEVEERIYFPALHGLCPALAAEVARLVQEHDAIVALLPGLRGLLGAGEMELSSERLHQLAQVLSAHEAEEEALIRECLQSQRPNDTEDEER